MNCERCETRSKGPIEFHPVSWVLLSVKRLVEFVTTGIWNAPQPINKAGHELRLKNKNTILLCCDCAVQLILQHDDLEMRELDNGHQMPGCHAGHSN